MEQPGLHLLLQCGVKASPVVAHPLGHRSALTSLIFQSPMGNRGSFVLSGLLKAKLESEAWNFLANPPPSGQQGGAVEWTISM